MTSTSNSQLPEIPTPDQLDHQDLLTQYGVTMEYVQRFEHIMKSILLLHRSFTAASSGSLTDESVEQLVSQMGRNTLGTVLNDLKSNLPELDLQPFPQSTNDALVRMVKLRNRLAHSYLVENSRVLQEEVGRRMLINELRWYAQIFQAMSTPLDRWLNSLIKQLGHSREELEKQLESVTNIELEELKANLQEMGLDA